MSESQIPAPPPGAILRPCAYCAEAIRPEAVVCRYCSRQLPRGMKTLTYQGTRYGVGVGTDEEYVLWDLTTGERIEVFPLTEEGWQKCWEAARRREDRVTSQAAASNQIWAWLSIGFGVVGFLLLPIIFGPIAIVMGIVGASQKQSLSWLGIALGAAQVIYVSVVLDNAFGQL